MSTTQHDPALPRLLTARELADEIGLSVQRIYQLARADEIPHVKLGRSIRFPVSAVSAWIYAGGTADLGN